MSSSTETRPTVTEELPDWGSVLAVVAHPDDESFGLGALIDAFGRVGSTVSVLCLTRGEASTIHGVSGDLRDLRARELATAAEALGARVAALRDHPDGRLAETAGDVLVDDIVAQARSVGAAGLLVFDLDGVSGHPDHAAASAAAVAAADLLGLPVLGWTVPAAVADELNAEFETTFAGRSDDEIDLRVPVERDRQRIASLSHASQAVPTSVLWRRLDLLGDVESLRWLRQGPARSTMRVDHLGDDRFDIVVRGHHLLVDQPVDVGGTDEGPTPTELFVASLASCVAFYARRYLRRHHLPEEGLRVTADFELGSKPARVGAMRLRIQVPDGVPEDRRDALLGFASHCTVHNSITHAPDIEVELA